MNIERIKDELKNNVADYVQEDAKRKAVGWLKDKVLPAAHEIADAYSTALKKSARDSHGWCKFRDTIFLPTLCDVALWFIGKSLEHIQEAQHGA